MMKNMKASVSRFFGIMGIPKAKLLMVLLLLAIFIFIPYQKALAQPAGQPVPDTGQVTCYNNTAVIGCPAFGQAFYGQDAQYNTNPRSYTKMDAQGNDLSDGAASWAIVRDNVTGLLWENKNDEGGIHDKDTTYTWTEAQTFIDNLNAGDGFGGYKDWRLPTLNELSMLVNSAVASPGPMIDGNWFPNTKASIFWSSTTDASDSTQAWAVDFIYGETTKTSKTTAYYFVRAVRGAPFGNNFADNLDGTVTDVVTGLMWTKTKPATAISWTWQEALAAVAALNGETYLGYNDWRLPSRNELQSIADYSRTSPAADPVFGMQVNAKYWTSTTEDGNSSYAWIVQLGSTGHVYTDGKVVTNQMLLVRDVTGYNLTVTKTGPGTVTSAPAGINCGDVCSAGYESGAEVTLTATPDAGAIFEGWSGGGCSGTQTTCTVTMEGDVTIEASFATGSAGTLPDTGQTKCYGNSGEIIPCPAAGAAFYGQDAQSVIHPRSYTKLASNGVELPELATKDDGWIMTRDNVTGLIWENKDGDAADIHIGSKTFTWCDTNTATNGGDPGTCGAGTGINATDTEAFINHLNDTNFGGYNDWRMPTVKELSMLINSSISGSYTTPMIDAFWFPFTLHTWEMTFYWSSTTRFGSASMAWYVDFSNGLVTDTKGEKSNSYYARAVRGGQSDTNLINSDNGTTVTDTVTGLMWSKEAIPGTYTWEGALAKVVTLNNEIYLGYNDWRLPDRNELQSLVNYSLYGNTAYPLLAGDTDASPYWSSTTYAAYDDYAWLVNFYNGVVHYGYGSKTSTNRSVRVVRGGQGAVASFSLDVSKSGTGSGTVTGEPAGINCGAECSAYYYSDTSVLLTAAPDDNSYFTGWSGDCSGTETSCTVTMDGDKAVTAGFAQCDTTPDPFSFTDQTNVALSTVITSNAITVNGITCETAISITGGTYAVNGGGYTSDGGTVNNGDTVTVQQTSASSYSTQTNATLTIGGVSGTFSVTTLTFVPPVNGVCGSSNGGTFTTAPATNLCAVGTPSAVTGNGSWTWTCEGENGGATANCSAAVSTLPSDIDYQAILQALILLNGSGFFTTYSSYDLNLDGKTDILWRNTATGENVAWLMNGTQLINYAALPTLEDQNWRIAGRGDFNRDKKTDILWRNTETGWNCVWLMNGTQFGSFVFLDTLEDQNWKIVGTGDFNRDDKADILWRNTATGWNCVWLMNGTQLGSYVFLNTLEDQNWKIAGTGDFNRDGKTDILWRNTETGWNCIWIMNGTQLSRFVFLDTLEDQTWKIVGTGDFNKDGKTDILWRNTATGWNCVWIMNDTELNRFVYLETLEDQSWIVGGTAY